MAAPVSWLNAALGIITADEDITNVPVTLTGVRRTFGDHFSSTGGAPASYIATGAKTSRTGADRAADTFNVLDWGLVCDGTTNNVPAFNVLMGVVSAFTGAANGGRVLVEFPNAGPGYAFASRATIPAGVEIVGKGRPTILCTGTTAAAFLIQTGNVAIRHIRFDGRYPTTAAGSIVTINNATGNVLIEDVSVLNPGGGITANTSYGVTVNRVFMENSAGHGVVLKSCYDCTVSYCHLQNCTLFGIILSTGCYRCLIEGNRTTKNGIELVGVTEGCYENRIIGNHAEGTGDNGISVTGWHNTVMGNVCKGCTGNGIEIYGERNTVVGNTCLNNAKSYSTNAGWRAGIAIQAAFGGTGQFNVIANNVIDDQQDTPTQQYGIWIGQTFAYPAWASGVSKVVGDYVKSGTSMYVATVAGTTGDTAPSWSDTQSDGGVTWRYVREFSAGSAQADYNEFSCNMIRKVVAGRYLDASGAANNSFIGGRQPVVLPQSLAVSQISNPGSVGSISVPTNTYRFLNGSTPSITVAAPGGAGQQATAVIASFFLFGFGTVNNGGSGYAVNDVLTLLGGTAASGTLRTVKVTAVDANGAITTITAGPTGSYKYAVLPPSDPQPTSGGTGTGATFNSPSWHVDAITVTSAGSNYLSVPAVTYTGVIGTPNSVATLASQLTVSAGVGQVVMDGSGTKLGTSGGSVGFMGATPVVRQSITGSRAGESASTASLRAALVALGLATDNTTA